MDATLLVAFLGGALALLSPCGALLLPAFFATTVGSGSRLVLHGAVFYVGLALTLVPLGLGASFLGRLLTDHRHTLILVAGLLIIAFGVLTALGGGFDAGRLLPERLRTAGSSQTGLLRVLLLGTVSGVAGFCAGPILGAVLTLAATSSPLAGGVTLAVYGAGMVVPLLLLALGWRRLGTSGRARLRGRELRLGPVSTHTTSLVSGTLLVVVGIVFLMTNGLASLPEVIPTHVLASVQRGLGSLARAVPDVAVVVVLAVVALGVWFVLDRRKHREPPA